MKKIATVALIGFPNVGKSTLFNRLLRERKALVHSLPGMTRDQVSGSCTLNGKTFVLIDTGGFFSTEDDPFSPLIKQKAQEAAEKADVILFILDGKRGLLPGEEELYFTLKRMNRKILIVVNKIDSPLEEVKLGDFYRLGEEKVFGVSAEHKRNLEELEQGLMEALPQAAMTIKEPKPLKIAIIGRINVGKSSLINRLCGEERLIVSERPGTTRDSIDTIIFRDKKAFCLVDTAGIRKLSCAWDKREKASIIRAKKDISRTDVICLVLDAQEFPVRQDLAVAHLACQSGKPLLIALNKWDLVEKNAVVSRNFRERIYARMDFANYAPILSVSALTGKRVIKILDTAERVYASGQKRVGTRDLNEFLSWLNKNYPPLSAGKRRLKIKYITQKGILPPTFILFTSGKTSFAPSSKKFFVQLLREKFGLWGTPVKLILRES